MLLLKAGASLERSRDDGSTALHDAAALGHAHVVQVRQQSLVKYWVPVQNVGALLADDIMLGFFWKWEYVC